MSTRHPATPAELLPALASLHPGRVALEVDDRAVTYAELDATVDRVAGWLTARLGTGAAGAPTRTAVGVRATGLIPMSVAMLAVARAGHIVVPIDPASPASRVDAIVDDIEAPLILCDDVEELAGLRSRADVVDVATAISDGLPFGAPVQLSGDDITSIIFTSGSTGRPKGTMSTRRLLVNSLERNRIVGISPGARRFGVPIAGTVGNFLRVMLSSAITDGATLVGYDIRVRGVQPLAGWLAERRIEHFATVPTVLRALLDEADPLVTWPHLGTVFTWGEAMRWSDVERLLPHLPAGRVIVTYRSTEASGIASRTIDHATPIGSGVVEAGDPMPGVEIRIVDGAGRPLPANTEGAVVVRGDVAAGYWRRPELTPQVFRADPDGVIVCWTGDRGRLDDAGRLHICGRADAMVKISGNRVDLGEIETQLAGLPGVADAAVVTREDAAGDLRLAAFVTARTHASPAALRAALGRLVPTYMMPDSIEVLDALPRLPNGKLDRNQLIHRERAVADVATDDRPADGLERHLAAIWSQVLGVPVGRNARFDELGGDSIRAARMFAVVERLLGYDRPVSLLIEAPTVAALAEALQSSDADRSFEPIVRVRTSGDLTPLIVVHGGGGDVMFAADIARHIDARRPVYGLRPGLLNGRRIPQQSIGELAELYVRELRAVLPTGPYALFGYSLGAYVALEMARLFDAAGERVTLLAIGDMLAPRVGPATVPEQAAPVTPLRARLHEQADAAGSSTRALRHLVGNRLRSKWRDRAPSRANLRRAVIRWHLSRGRAVPPALRHDLALSELRRLRRAYRPTEGYDGRVLVIRSTRRDLPDDLGWRQLTPDCVTAEVPGTHEALVHDPAVGLLAGVLERSLAASELTVG